MNLLADERHSLGGLWNLLGDKEEEHSLTQKGGNRHGALLTTRCRTQTNF